MYLTSGRGYVERSDTISGICLTLSSEKLPLSGEKCETPVFTEFGRLYSYNKGVLRFRTVFGTVGRWHKDHNGAEAVPALRESL